MASAMLSALEFTRLLSVTHLTRLSDPLRKRRSGGCRSPVVHAGLERGVAQLGGSAGETAGSSG